MAYFCAYSSDGDAFCFFLIAGKQRVVLTFLKGFKETQKYATKTL